MRKFTKLFSILCAALVSNVYAADVVVKDSDINAGESITWTNNNTYILDGFVFVEEGATLNIQAGTVVKAKSSPSTGDNASALIIARGAKISAVGSSSAPIIFTSELDDVNDPSDLTHEDKGLWGGLIILGKGLIAYGNDSTHLDETNIEGIPSTETRALFGGNDDTDNSGILKYVSIRHGGAALAPGDEINGLTLGAVGSGTTIDHIEVFANDDDGIEWFGGAVAVRHAVVSFCGDDSYDYDYGWRGKGQFWFTLQGEAADNAGEHDGAKPDGEAPYSNPIIYNATYIGSGAASTAKNSTAIHMRDATAGTYANSIFTDFANDAVEIEDLAAEKGVDSRQRAEDGELQLLNNIWFGFGSGSSWADIVRGTDGGEDSTGAWLEAIIESNWENSLTDPELEMIDRTANGKLNPVPSSTGAAYSNLADYPSDDAWFETVAYKGAFGGSNWAKGWTALSNMGYFNEEAPVIGANEVLIKDGDLAGGQTYNWEKENTYILDGFVFLEESGVLNIEAGTVIKAKSSPTTGDNASALIITRGAKINANGTAELPVIFTSELDDVTDASDLTHDDKGLWGGLIILGKGKIAYGNDSTHLDETNIEGIPSEETRAMFGGSDDEDNSGILKYVSIRHGGAALAPGDEINGLTLGAVGSGTTIDYIEVYANDDDGIEWFGGAVEVKHAAVSFCGDDSYDYDYGWRGKGQFWFTLQGEAADNAGEHDGAKPDGEAPYSNPTIYNATYIGSGSASTAKNSTAIHMRDATAGIYANSVFTAFANDALEIEDLAAEKGVDSRQRVEDGELKLLNNVWYDFGSGSQWSEIVRGTEGGEDETAQWLIDLLEGDWSNEIIDPEFTSIGRSTDGSCNPSADTSSAIFRNLAQLPEGSSWFNEVSYKGAFGTENWLKDWTALSSMGYMSSSVNIEELVALSSGVILGDAYPNPAQGTVTIEMSTSKRLPVTLKLYDVTGNLVELITEQSLEGVAKLNFDVSQLPSGLYYYSMTAGDYSITKKLVVNK